MRGGLIMNVKYDLVVDFARPNKSNTVIISEGDSESRVCVFTLLADKQPMDMITVSTATVRGVREDGSVIIGEAVILEDESGDKINQVAYTIPASVAAINGKVIMTITLMSTLGATITSFEFYLNVRNQLYNENDYVNDQDMTGFRDLLNRTLTALHTMEQMTKQTALPNPYPLRFTHDGVLYTYTGEVETDIVLGNIAFIDTEDYTEPGEAVDETAARIAVEAADRAESASESAEDASEAAVSASESASQSMESASDSAEIAEGYAGQAIAAATSAAQSAAEIRENLNLDDLNDVNITTPLANDVLKFTGSEWVNGSNDGVWIGPKYSDISHQVVFNGLNNSKAYMLFAEDTVADYSNVVKSGTTLTFTVVNDVVGVTEFYLRELN